MSVENRLILLGVILALIAIIVFINHFRVKILVGQAKEDLVNQYTPDLLKPRPIPNHKKTEEEEDSTPKEG